MTSGGATTTQQFAYNGMVVLEAFQGGSLTNRYLQGPGLDNVLADEQVHPGSGSTNYWALGDHLGSVRDVVDNSGVVQKHLAYSAFGKTTSDTNPGLKENYGFSGGFTDGESGLINHWQRWMNPATGNWMSQDPTGFAAGDANLQRYVGNTPDLLRDPLGLDEAGPNSNLGDISNIIRFFDPEVWQWLQMNRFELWWQERSWWLSEGYGEWGKDGRAVLVIKSSLNSMEAAQAVISIIRDKNLCGFGADFHATMMVEANWKNIDKSAEWSAYVVQRMAETAKAGTYGYIGILSIMNSGIDFVVTINELGNGNYWAVLPFLPLGIKSAVTIRVARESATTGRIIAKEIKISGELIQAWKQKIIMTYKEASKLTAGCRHEFEAHHILEEWVLKMLKKDPSSAPAIILSYSEHEAINTAFRTAYLAEGGYDKLTKAQIWAVYQQVYREHPDWLNRIAPLFW